MGVCIAALSNGGRACVVAADRDASPGLPVDRDCAPDSTGIVGLTDTCVVLATGNGPAATEVIARVQRAMAKTGTSALQRIAELLTEAFLALREEQAEQRILGPRGLTIKEFKESGFHRIPFQRYKQLDEELFNFSLSVDFLVAGLDRRGGHIGWIHDQGRTSRLEWVDQRGYHAMGVGFSRETILLSMKNQHKDFSVAQTIYNVYCAKMSPGSPHERGHHPEIAVIGKGGVEFLSGSFLSWLDDLVQKNRGRSPSVGVLDKLFSRRHSKNPRAA